MTAAELTALAERLEAMGKLREVAMSIEDQDDTQAQHRLAFSVETLRAAARVVRDSTELLGTLKLMFDSAYPHPIEHPTMFKAWGEARILLIRHGVVKPSKPEDSI